MDDTLQANVPASDISHDMADQPVSESDTQDLHVEEVPPEENTVTNEEVLIEMVDIPSITEETPEMLGEPEKISDNEPQTHIEKVEDIEEDSESYMDDTGDY